jgi:hypothetical protein
MLVWDIQTGVVIRDVDFCNEAPGNLIFSGNQRTITLINGQYFLTYDGLNGTRLFGGSMLLSDSHQLGAQWAHNESLQYATSYKAKGKLTINIWELQLTPKLSCLLVESFHVPPQDGKFSFSPASFHASFVTKREVVILDIQDSRILLHTKTTQPLYKPPGQFSPDGCFFACGILEHKLSVWRNTPAGYVAWSTLQPRLPFNKFSFSPTVTSILTWGPEGIQLLHPEISASSLSPNKIKPLHQHRNHLVTCSADGTWIATAQHEGSVVTVLDSLLGVPLWSIHVGVHIQDIKIVDDTIFVADGYRLISWKLDTGGGATVSGSYDTVGVGAHMDGGGSLVLSNDCSQIAFAVGMGVFLYDIKVQEILMRCTMGNPVMLMRFSQDGSQLGVFCNSSMHDCFNFTKFKMEDWCSADTATVLLDDEKPWVSLFRSPHGYCIGSKSGWVENSRDGNLLWLPPNWRTKHGLDVGWEGNFLALMGSHHQEPIIIELQPQPHLSPLPDIFQPPLPTHHHFCFFPHFHSLSSPMFLYYRMLCSYSFLPSLPPLPSHTPLS